jgi:type II secretory pathway component PulJ
MVATLTKKEDTGFTLFEVLVYLALFSLLVTCGVSVTYQMLRSSAATAHDLQLQNDGNFVIEKFEWALSGSSSVSVPNATTFKVVRADLQSDRPLVFTVASSTWYLIRGSGSSTSLTSAQISVHDVHISWSGTTLYVTFWLDKRVFQFTSIMYE